MPHIYKFAKRECWRVIKKKAYVDFDAREAEEQFEEFSRFTAVVRSGHPRQSQAREHHCGQRETFPSLFGT